METEQIIEEVLAELFNQYEQIGAERIDMGEFITSRGGSPREIKIEMERRGLLRFMQITNDSFAISERGIRRTAPDYFQSMADGVIKFATKNGGSALIGEALNIPHEHPHKITDIGAYITTQRLATVQAGSRVYLP
jgi:hypothetical protein